MNEPGLVELGGQGCETPAPEAGVHYQKEGKREPVVELNKINHFPPFMARHQVSTFSRTLHLCGFMVPPPPQPRLRIPFLLVVFCTAGGCEPSCATDTTHHAEGWAIDASAQSDAAWEEDDMAQDEDTTNEAPILPHTVMAKHLWSSSYEACDRGEGPRFLDEFTDDDFIVHDHPVTDEREHVEALSFNVNTAPIHANAQTLAQVSLDVLTGEELACVDTFPPFASTTFLIRFDPVRRIVYHAYHDDLIDDGYPDDGSRPHHGFINGVLGFHLDTGDLLFHYSEPRLQNDFLFDVALAFEREQVVFSPHSGRIVSMDASSGEALWEHIDPTAFRVSLLTPAHDKLFIHKGNNLTELDHQGRATLRHAWTDETYVSGPVLMHDGTIVLLEETLIDDTRQTQLKLLNEWGTSPLHVEQGCNLFFTMSPDHIGCLDKDEAHQSARIVRLDLDGSNRLERQVTIAPELTGMIKTDALPLSRRHVALFMSVKRRDAPEVEDEQLHVLILDIEDPQAHPVHVEITPPVQILGDIWSMTPLFTRSGILIFSFWNQFHAIETNIPWTDRGPAPRGPRLGDNQNAGFASSRP